MKRNLPIPNSRFTFSTFGKIHIWLLLIGLSLATNAQDVNFSQYQYSPLWINPANSVADNNISLTAHFRNQYRNPNPAYRTPSFTFTLPFINKKTGHRWGGIGLSAISDQTGNTPLRQVNQGIALSYAHNVFLGKGYNLSLGVQAGFYQFAINSNEITTGEQYSNNGGFDRNLPTGESFASSGSNSYADLATGLQLIKEDSTGRKQFHFGIAAYHFNRPNISLLGDKNQLALRYVANLGISLYSSSQFSIYPEALASIQNYSPWISLGSRFTYHFASDENSIEKSNVLDKTSISFMPRYIFNNAVAVGIELQKSNFLIAFNYDFNTTALANRLSSTGAYEIAIGYRKYIGRIVKKDPLPNYSVGDIRSFYKEDNLVNIAKKLQQERESNIAYTEDEADTNWNKTRDYKFELEKRFVFGFNEAGIGQDAKKFADDLVALLKDNRHLKLLVIGYSDDIGTEKANLYISKERAYSFVKYIQNQGIAPTRLKYDGKGEAEPLTNGRSSSDRAKNRRVRFLIY